MTGRGDPPEGTPDGVPGGEDEYRSTVFDESFIRGAHLQEFSAAERMADHEHPVRSLPGRAGVSPSGASSKQGLVLLLLIVLAFGTAVYMGTRSPYQEPEPPRPQTLRSDVVPLAPRGTVPGAAPEALFQHSPAADFHSGAAGVTLPPVRRTEHFSESQVLAALTTAKTYVVESAVDPDVLTGGAVRSVRELLDPGQHEQFDRSMRNAAADGRHAATAWLVRFDPRQVSLADSEVRVRGTLAATEMGKDALEVTADHVFVYALRAPEEADRARSSLFTVRREVRMRIERDDLRDRQLSVEQAAIQAGPLDCAAATHERLHPLLAGERADSDRSAGTDPYARAGTTTSMCGVLAQASQPSPPS